MIRAVLFPSEDRTVSRYTRALIAVRPGAQHHHHRGKHGENTQEKKHEYPCYGMEGLADLPHGMPAPFSDTQISGMRLEANAS